MVSHHSVGVVGDSADQESIGMPPIPQKGRGMDGARRSAANPKAHSKAGKERVPALPGEVGTVWISGCLSLRIKKDICTRFASA